MVNVHSVQVVIVVQWWSGVHGMQVHCCLPCAPRVYYSKY